MTNAANLRDWQRRALDRAIRTVDRGDRDFLAVACPGAGKTIWALTVAEDLIRRGVIDLVVVVVPSDEMRTQWSKNTRTSLELRPYDLRDVMVRKRGYDGVVTTYQALGGKTAGMLRRELGAKTMVILDEVHHAADSKSYGDNLHHAFDAARFRLMLTGTPWRTKNREKIPFVSYDDLTRELEHDFAYTYAEAIKDRACAPIRFAFVGADVAFKPNVDSEVTQLSMTADLDLAREDHSPAMQALLDPSSGWMTDVLTQAHKDLLGYRQEVPDAGGLVIARDQAHAYAISESLRRIAGVTPPVIVSETDDAKTAIENFRSGTDPWVVAVRMIAEGVDIPRLKVGVYATNYQTRMFFTQVVGRFVRLHQDQVIQAMMYVPPNSTVSRFAHEIEAMATYALAEVESAREETPGEPWGMRGQTQRVILGSESTGLEKVVTSGESVDGANVIAWRDFLDRRGVPVQYATNLATDGRAPSAPPAPQPVPERKPRSVLEKELRGEIKSLVGKVAHHYYGDHTEAQQVNAELCRVFSTTRAKASVNQLERMREYLRRWLRDGAQPWAS